MLKYSQFLSSGVSKMSDQGEPQIAACKQYKLLAKLLQVSQILLSPAQISWLKSDMRKKVKQRTPNCRHSPRHTNGKPRS